MAPPPPPRISEAAYENLKSAIDTVFENRQGDQILYFARNHFPRDLADELESKDEGFFNHMAKYAKRFGMGGKFFACRRDRAEEDFRHLYDSTTKEVEKQSQLDR